MTYETEIILIKVMGQIVTAFCGSFGIYLYIKGVKKVWATGSIWKRYGVSFCGYIILKLLVMTMNITDRSYLGF